MLAGPSGAGKTRLTERLGLPVLRLDDFYKEAGDPTLPMVHLPAGAPMVDWDDPRAWDHQAAVAAIERLCRDGCVEVPAYDIATSSVTGSRTLHLAGAAYFVAEGIFAQEVVGDCRRRGVLADAICLDRSTLRTFVLRLRRDLREHRKPPWVLVRRGLRLMRAQRAIVENARSLGCRVLSPAAAYAAIRAATGGSPAPTA